MSQRIVPTFEKVRREEGTLQHGNCRVTRESKEGIDEEVDVRVIT
jgi:hypothetical protein